MRVKRVGVYVGVDPTAPSMHIGHILPMMPLFWLWFHGHPAVTLIGGSTARIGDPTGRLKTRDAMPRATTAVNITGIHFQLKRLWHNAKALRAKHGHQDDWAAKHHIVNNSYWLQKVTIYDFLKTLGRGTRIGPMLSRETVKRKLHEGDGMSLAEFMYPMLQGWDFWHLYDRLGVQMQIGGSDQYGNIVAGMDSLKTIRDSEEAENAKESAKWKDEPIGFTVPLVTDSAGAKIGKSAGNAIWLDEYKTSPFELYGYFMRRSDEEVENLLKLYTFIPVSEIRTIMESHVKDPAKRLAQHHLAFEVLSLVHGSQQALVETQQHLMRFGGSLPPGFGGQVTKEPSSSTGMFTPNTKPRTDIQLPRSIMDLPPAKILWAAGLVNSGSEGQRLVAAEGAYVAGVPGQMKGLMPGNLSWTPVKQWFTVDTSNFLLDDKILILRKGKHNVRVIELISDEKWKQSGKSYPGEPFQGRVRTMREEIKRSAEEKGVSLTESEVRQMARERLYKSSELTVSNNKNIKLPNRQEQRQRKLGQDKGKDDE
jgi:tyrosyl-tRNA synthetase